MESGILRVGQWGYSLELDGGGQCQLYGGPSRMRRWLGQRVTVDGTRSGFDLLDVERVVSERDLQETFWDRFIICFQ